MFSVVDSNPLKDAVDSSALEDVVLAVPWKKGWRAKRTDVHSK